MDDWQGTKHTSPTVSFPVPQHPQVETDPKSSLETTATPKKTKVTEENYTLKLGVCHFSSEGIALSVLRTEAFFKMMMVVRSVYPEEDFSCKCSLSEGGSSGDTQLL